MNKTKLVELGNLYFHCFENKDLSTLEKLFSDEIILFDPIIKKVEGIKNVLKANLDIFNSANKIVVNIKKMFADVNSDTIIAELEIHFDNNIVNVVDIIEIDIYGKIKSVTAYLDSRQIL